MNDTRRATGRLNGLRAAALLGMLIAAPVLLTACSSGSTAAPTTTVTSATTSTAVVSSTSDTVVTETDVVTDTAEVTKTRTAASNGGGGGSGTDSCPDPATLGAVTPNYDAQYPINAINCSGEWAVGSYEADGKNQTTGIWRNSGGAWSYQDRATVCAAAVNLPPELYAQACNGN